MRRWSAMGWWTTDIGGSTRVKRDGPVVPGELLVRWFEFGVFSPIWCPLHGVAASPKCVFLLCAPTERSTMAKAGVRRSFTRHRRRQRGLVLGADLLVVLPASCTCAERLAALLSARAAWRTFAEEGVPPMAAPALRLSVRHRGSGRSPGGLLARPPICSWRRFWRQGAESARCAFGREAWVFAYVWSGEPARRWRCGHRCHVPMAAPPGPSAGRAHGNAARGLFPTD